MHRYKQLLVLLNLDDQDRTTIKHAQKRYQEFIDNCAPRGVTVASLFRSGHDPSKIPTKLSMNKESIWLSSAPGAEPMMPPPCWEA